MQSSNPEPVASANSEQPVSPSVGASPARKTKSGKNTGSSSDSASERGAARNSEEFLVVGIGASAGGIQALEKFFEHLPSNPTGINLAFVVVIHLLADFESNLASIIQKHTTLKVQQVTEPVLVKPATVYVIPPGKQLSMSDGHIRLTELEPTRLQRAPIDLFFRTLAETHTEWSGAIVLSGTGSDGSIGLPRVKERGGFTLAQNPEESEFSQMPRNAIATGFVDKVLPVTQMGQWLLNYVETRQRIRLQTPLEAEEEENTLPPNDNAEDTQTLEQAAAPGLTSEELTKSATESESEKTKRLHSGDRDGLLEIVALLHVRTGHNFAQYKRATLLRRIERRLQLNNLIDLAQYQLFLGSHPAEIEALLRDLLISVTNFFRDKEVWEVLKTDVIPLLFQNKGEVDSVVRVWVAGCATGEEAYSMAMLLHEYANRLSRPPGLQIFASDLDEHALRVAREGSYLETIALDVSPERLQQFFNYNSNTRRYQVKKEIRDSILFAHHNLLKDPPFSRLDLISCRNLMIYLNREAQQQVLNLFHFSLLPGGFLLLGTSESADTTPQLFLAPDKKNHIYRRQNILTTAALSFKGGFGLRLEASLPSPTPDHSNLPSVNYTEKTRLPTDLFHQIQGLLVQTAILVDSNLDIIHIFRQAARYLSLSEGEFTNNLIKLILPDLRFDLQSHLFELTRTHNTQTVKTRRIPLALDSKNYLVRLFIQPITEPEALQSYLLIIFDEDEIADEVKTGQAAPEVEVIEGQTSDSNLQATEIENPIIDLKGVNLASNVSLSAPASSTAPLSVSGEASLLARRRSGSANPVSEMIMPQFQNEIALLKGQLQVSIEQHDTAVEEHKAANEELQAINEEFRSATEELETGKEELQALNEELQTVNQELKLKIEEISTYNSDLQNLMNSTDLATIFLNRQMHLKRFTPRVDLTTMSLPISPLPAQNSNNFQEIEALYLRHSRSAFGLALKILQNTDLAEDAVQEAFLKYWKNPAVYNPTLGSFINWMLAVVRNICLDHLRKVKKIDIVPLEFDGIAHRLDYLVDPAKPVEEVVLESLQRKEIRSALKTISAEQSSLIELAFFKGLSHNQIAVETGLPLGTVKSRIRQGLIKLKIHLDTDKVGMKAKANS